MTLAPRLRGTRPTIVTVANFITLTPFDTQEIFLEVDASASTYWHLRYRAANTTTNKWEFVGGPPLYAVIENVDTLNAGGAGVWSDLTGAGNTPGPDIQIPVPGFYLMRFGALISNPGTWTTRSSTQVAPGLPGAGDPTVADSAQHGIWMTGLNADISVEREQQANITVGRVRMMIRSGADTGGALINFSRRWMEITPYRVRQS
jgi:hypothetical protein